MPVNNLSNTFTGESLLPETSLDIIHDFSMRRVGLVEDVLQVQVSRPKTIAEVLSENPTAV